MRAVLPAARATACASSRTWARPTRSRRRARRPRSRATLGLRGLKIAAVTGDDVLDVVRQGDFRFEESGEQRGVARDRLVSANAYLGAAPIVDALRRARRS